MFERSFNYVLIQLLRGMRSVYTRWMLITWCTFNNWCRTAISNAQPTVFYIVKCFRFFSCKFQSYIVGDLMILSLISLGLFSQDLETSQHFLRFSYSLFQVKVHIFLLSMPWIQLRSEFLTLKKKARNFTPSLAKNCHPFRSSTKQSFPPVPLLSTRQSIHLSPHLFQQKITW